MSYLIQQQIPNTGLWEDFNERSSADEAIRAADVAREEHYGADFRVVQVIQPAQPLHPEAGTGRSKEPWQ